MYGLLTLAIIAIAMSLIFYACHKFHVFVALTAWIKSTTEEKVGLTKLVGHFNANGYLVHSDSDIYIGTNGSFKRFESFDRDIKIATTSFGSDEWFENEEPQIPPQPLRPAPVPTISSADIIRESSLEDKQSPPPILTTTIISNNECIATETSIKPLPRPVSSMNVNAMQQSNAQFIQPPPAMQGRVAATHTLPLLDSEAPPQELSVNLTADLTMNECINGSNLIATRGGNPFGIRGTNGTRSRSGSVSEDTCRNVATSASGNGGVGAATGDYVEVISGVLKRAVSCESVCSDTSVALGDLEENNITGYLCIGLEYDSEQGEMIANVLEAKDLINPNFAINGATNTDEQMDTYVKIFLLPDKNINVQTKIYRNSNSPSYQERVIFTLHPRDQMQTALLFHIYATDMNSHTLIGEGELSLADVSLRQPVTTWVTLTDTSQAGTEFGELMFSLSYLPTAERLTVVVVKGRKLKFQSDKEQGEPFVKAYLLQYGKKIHKKKTSSKKPEKSPIFNESMMFNIPAHMLQVCLKA